MIETYRGVVYPWLTDQMGHLVTFRYVEMFDTAFYHLIHAIEDGSDANDRLGWADVRQTIDYQTEVRVGALVLVRSGVIETGRSSVRARHVMTDPSAKTVHAVMECKTVRFDLLARKSCPLSSQFIDNAARFPVEI